MSEENNKNTEDSSPGLLISEIQNTSLTKPIILATVIHVILIGIFSVGYINMCIKYKTMSPKEAIAQEVEEKAQKDLEAARKKKADDAVKSDKGDKPKTTDAGKSEKPGTTERVPQVIKDTQEVIKEKPTAPSSLNSFDDFTFNWFSVIAEMF